MSTVCFVLSFTGAFVLGFIACFIIGIVLALRNEKKDDAHKERQVHYRMYYDREPVYDKCKDVVFSSKKRRR